MGPIELAIICCLFLAAYAVYKAVQYRKNLFRKRLDQALYEASSKYIEPAQNYFKDCE